MNAIISLLIYFVVIVILVALVDYALRTFAVADPLAKIIQFATYAVAIFVIILLLLRLAGIVVVPLP
jgi:hypothetical protein